MRQTREYFRKSEQIAALSELYMNIRRRFKKSRREKQTSEEEAGESRITVHCQLTLVHHMVPRQRKFDRKRKWKSACAKYIVIPREVMN